MEKCKYIVSLEKNAVYKYIFVVIKICIDFLISNIFYTISMISSSEHLDKPCVLMKDHLKFLYADILKDSELLGLVDEVCFQMYHCNMKCVYNWDNILYV